MILGEGVTAAAFFAYFLQLQAKSKGVRAGGQLGKPILPLIFWSFCIKTKGQKKNGQLLQSLLNHQTKGPAP